MDAPRLGTLLLVLWWLAPGTAHAYLVDANDARVAPPGVVEYELQPIGLLHSFTDQRTYLIAPSLQLYIGLAEEWDMIVLTRGYGAVDGVGTEYALDDNFVAVRRMLVHGTYSDDGEGDDGPSLTLQVGAFLPPTDAEEAYAGASVALLFAQQWDAGTLHLNLWLNGWSDEVELFGSAVMEGPGDWEVRPVVEVWVSHLVDDQLTVSGMAGVVGDVDDALTLEAGVRFGGNDQQQELEVRAAAWWSWDS